MMNYWMAKGPPENWDVSFQKNNVWGVIPRYRNLWIQIVEGDWVLFYATRPVKGVIGYGEVRSRFESQEPLWPDEIEAGKALWGLRFKFDVIFCFAKREWEGKSIGVSPRQAGRQSGFQRMRQEAAKELIERLGAA